MIRTTEIRPPSVRAETLDVAKAAAAVIVIVAASLAGVCIAAVWLRTGRNWQTQGA